MLRQFWKNELGGSASEYALILAVVGPGIGAAALVMGANVKESGSSFESNLDATNAVASTTASNNGGGNNGGGNDQGGGSTPTPSPTATSTPTPSPTDTSKPKNCHATKTC